jgi:hypothetical protein
VNTWLFYTFTQHVHNLTLLSLRDYELCITITGAPLLAPLHEGMRVATTQHTKVATRLSVLWSVVSLAAQSMLGFLPIDASQAGVVGEMVIQFWERVEWCSCLEVASLEVCDLVLGVVDGQAH